MSTDGLSSAPNCKPIVIGSSNDNSSRAGIHKISDVRNLKQLIGGGGGGGASFIFQVGTLSVSLNVLSLVLPAVNKFVFDKL